VVLPVIGSPRRRRDNMIVPLRRNTGKSPKLT
jgi:hypothetical protein